MADAEMGAPRASGGQERDAESIAPLPPIGTDAEPCLAGQDEKLRADDFSQIITSTISIASASVGHHSAQCGRLSAGSTLHLQTSRNINIQSGLYIDIEALSMGPKASLLIRQCDACPNLSMMTHRGYSSDAPRWSNVMCSNTFHYYAPVIRSPMELSPVRWHRLLFRSVAALLDGIAESGGEHLWGNIWGTKCKVELENAMLLQPNLYLALALCLPLANGCRDHRLSARSLELESVNNEQSLAPSIKNFAPLVEVTVDQVTVKANTTSVASASVQAGAAVVAETVSSTVLVIARDKASAYSAYSGLNDHAIPYTVLLVPSTGITLPKLNDSATVGNFGLIVVQSEVSYLNNKTNTYHSALTDSQWAQIYNYQTVFGVRMVRLDVAPSASTGTASLGGCCTTGDQEVSISNDTAFPTAGLQVGAGLSTTGLWHYPAKIIDSSIATEFAQFSASVQDGFNSSSTAAVINKIKGREQMVFFIGFSTDWSVTSNLLQHAWIQWGTRGLYTGYRRAMLTPQIDDMFLETPIYDDNTTNFRVSTDDLDGHVQWIPTVSAKLNNGSDWFLEVGHNGNGNIETVDTANRGNAVCEPGPIEYDDQIDTPLEFAKPMGTGTDLYPSNMTTYPNYSTTCTGADTLLTWWQTTTNLDSFAHISHTFTHQDENNATYADVYREITWNRAWLAAVGISNAKKFSPNGIIPPAITGMHNGDALKGWADGGIKNVVGDNTRSVLMNKENEHWPLISTVAANGYAGIQITPRWASNIYYNCDLPACTTAEWQKYSAGKGNFSDLLTLEKNTNVRHLLGLHHDPYMFHQANMRWNDVDETTVNGVTGSYSLLMTWVETVVTEYLRLVKWPLISQTHDTLAATFMSRMARDACKPSLSWVIDPSQQIITGITVGATGNTCTEAIPVTIPTPVKSTTGARVEQLGSDPQTLWVTLSGKPYNAANANPKKSSAKNSNNSNSNSLLERKKRTSREAVAPSHKLPVKFPAATQHRPQTKVHLHACTYLLYDLRPKRPHDILKHSTPLHTKYHARISTLPIRQWREEGKTGIRLRISKPRSFNPIDGVFDLLDSSSAARARPGFTMCLAGRPRNTLPSQGSSKLSLQFLDLAFDLSTMHASSCSTAAKLLPLARAGTATAAAALHTWEEWWV
ncbi:hypothetical protein G7Y89_g292 [Cudoniella acicularis]|uniref:Extracellular serine-rich protein n=1 Tax=Cudoniella acicularis TaxID=354080 RepID=A0A8H4RYC4_9HELO|nr:hypothetical protein G7Y89_g292 [Cudoniella acicularis]